MGCEGTVGEYVYCDGFTPGSWKVGNGGGGGREEEVDLVVDYAE